MRLRNTCIHACACVFESHLAKRDICVRVQLYVRMFRLSLALSIYTICALSFTPPSGNEGITDTPTLSLSPRLCLYRSPCHITLYIYIYIYIYTVFISVFHILLKFGKYLTAFYSVFVHFYNILQFF